MQTQLKNFWDKGFVQTDINTDLGWLSIDIDYSIRIIDGDIDLNITAVQESRDGGLDLVGLFDEDNLATHLLECLGVAS
jgi:hypothetical protein